MSHKIEIRYNDGTVKVHKGDYTIEGSTLVIKTEDDHDVDVIILPLFKIERVNIVHNKSLNVIA